MTSAISEFNFPMKISNISQFKKSEPTEMVICGVPWQVVIEKCFGVLFLSLYCKKEENSSEWFYAAQASVKLLPFDHAQDAKEIQMEPYVFCQARAIKLLLLISLDELYDTKNNYVKDDTTHLEIKIEVVDVNDANGSIVTLKSLDQINEESVTAGFRLTVYNIDELMAVKTQAFTMQTHSWTLMVYKSRSNHLSVGLSTNEHTYCKVQVSCKLVSATPNVEPKTILGSKTDHFGHLFWEVGQLASWKELFEPQNGFVNKNSAMIEVEVRMGAGIQNQETACSAKKRRATTPLRCDANTIRLECSICFEDFKEQSASSTQCGHIFCTECIKGVIRARKQCPTCNLRIQLNKLRRVYLPM